MISTIKSSGNDTDTHLKNRDKSLPFVILKFFEKGELLGS